MSLHTGGNAVNASTALAQLGTPGEIIGKVGSDPFGDFLLRELDDRHIGTQGISRDLEIGTSAMMVMVGGAPLTQAYADQIGADGYAPNAGAAVRKAKKSLGMA